jgi:hypothetical protein
MLTPVIEPCGEGCRIHHIKSDSIARDGRDTFIPLRHVSKQKRRIFELEAENRKLREQASEGERVGRMLLEYRDDPPVKTAGPIEGAWYEGGDILAIIMERDEFTTGELLTRLAYLMGVREER